MEHLERAAACGNAKAMTLLGIAYKKEKGIGVAKDIERARRNYEAASAMGLLWPMLLQSKLELEAGRHWCGWSLRFKAASLGWKIATKNIKDER